VVRWAASVTSAVQPRNSVVTHAQLLQWLRGWCRCMAGQT
jgi:hypothetical protein